MDHLFKYWDFIEKRLREKNVFLFFDYDGTLTPIVEKPEDAVLSSRARGLLGRLSKFKNCKLALISGRSLEDLAGVVGINGIFYAGNHGLEIKGINKDFQVPVPGDIKKAMQQIRVGLRKYFCGVEGVRVEDKGATLSLHYRLAKEKDIPVIKQSLEKILKTHRALGTVDLVAGKKVFEIRPAVKWDKGRAILWFLDNEGFRDSRRQTTCVYVGDDITDEDAFKVLGEDDITVWVGEEKKTYARYFLRDTGEVLGLLDRLAALLDGRGSYG